MTTARLPFVVTRPPADEHGFMCLFSDTAIHFPVECLRFSLPGLALSVQMLRYLVWVRFATEFKSDQLLALARHGLPSEMVSDEAMRHVVILAPRAVRIFIMETVSEAQLEHELALMKQHLLSGTFDDDEQWRYCHSCTCLVEAHSLAPGKRLDMQCVRRHFHMQWSETHGGHQVACTAVALAEMMERLLPDGGEWRGSESASETPSFDNLGEFEPSDFDNDEWEHEEITIVLRPDDTLVLTVRGDRALLVETLHILLFILSRFLVDE